MSRSYAADDPEIGDRMRQLQAERVAAIAGVPYGEEPTCIGECGGCDAVNHHEGCPYWPGLPPAPPPMSPAALAILSDHRRAVADWVDSHVRHKLWTGPEEYTKGMGGCAVDCPHPDHKHAVADWAEGEIDWTDTYADGVCR